MTVDEAMDRLGKIIMSRDFEVVAGSPASYLAKVQASVKQLREAIEQAERSTVKDALAELAAIKETREDIVLRDGEPAIPIYSGIRGGSARLRGWVDAMRLVADGRTK